MKGMLSRKWKFAGALMGFLLLAGSGWAVMIGSCPGIDGLIERADAIVILRIEKSDGVWQSPTLLSTHDCYVYQTLKGYIPAGKIIQLRLLDSHEFPCAYSPMGTYLAFLMHKATPDEPTEYRSIPFNGHCIPLPFTGWEKPVAGATLHDKIVHVIERAITSNRENYEKTDAFLKKMLKNPQQNNSTPVQK